MCVQSTVARVPIWPHHFTTTCRFDILRRMCLVMIAAWPDLVWTLELSRVLMRETRRGGGTWSISCRRASVGKSCCRLVLLKPKVCWPTVIRGETKFMTKATFSVLHFLAFFYVPGLTEDGQRVCCVGYFTWSWRSCINLSVTHIHEIYFRRKRLNYKNEIVRTPAKEKVEKANIKQSLWNQS